MGMPESSLREVQDLQYTRDVAYPAGVGFRQLLITGPPGSGKSTQVAAIGGWPHEGYLDLASPGWWRSRSLSLRPCEVHLGFPFRGLPGGLALFDEAWAYRPVGEPTIVDEKHKERLRALGYVQ